MDLDKILDSIHQKKLRNYQYEGEEHLLLVQLIGWTASAEQPGAFDAVDE